MKSDDQPAHAAYIFSEDASYQLVSQLRHSGLPPGVHFVGSVTGQWQIVAIVEFDDLTELPAIVESVFGGQGGSVDPASAYALGMNAIKRSVYTEVMALVRIDVAGIMDGDGLEELRGQLAEAIGEEFNFVFGDFDVFACVTAEDDDDMLAKLFRLRGIGAIERTDTLFIIDYVCADEDAPKAYRRRTRTD
jgi:uncharacterized protein with GYD domain